MPYEKNKTTYQDEEWFEREQREELVNTLNRESYFSFGVESTHPPLRVLFFYAFL